MDTKFCWFVMFAKDKIIIIIAESYGLSAIA